MRRKTFILVIISALLFTSCQNSVIFEKYNKIPEYKWQYNNKESFTFRIKDTTTTYNVYLNLRHTGNYQFSNIWIMIYIKNPDGKISFKRHEFTLAAIDGKWLGQGMGDIMDHKLIFEKNLRFSEGEYTIVLQHDMRMDELPSIMDVGISIEKSQP